MRIVRVAGLFDRVVPPAVGSEVTRRAVRSRPGRPGVIATITVTGVLSVDEDVGLFVVGRREHRR